MLKLRLIIDWLYKAAPKAYKVWGAIREALGRK